MKISSLWNALNKTTPPTGQPVSQQAKETSVSESLLKDYKTSMTKDVNAIFEKHQIEPDAETQKNVNTFMKNAQGTEIGRASC